MQKRLFLYTNHMASSEEIAQNLREKAAGSDQFEIQEELSGDTDLIVCIGGDGTLLHLIHEFDFPETPIVGINTGHLGFFQNIQPDQIDTFLAEFAQYGLHTRVLSTIESQIKTEDGLTILNGLNEMVLRGTVGSVIHLDVTIGNSFIEHFSGDAVLVATPAGSTGYNYSLGGSIVDPRLNLMQVTPIAPMNNRTYRSFTSSLILPADNTLKFVPENGSIRHMQIETDGFVYPFENVHAIRILYSRKKLRLIRDTNEDFWGKVKDKYL